MGSTLANRAIKAEELPEETARIEYGNPSANSWRVLKQGRRQVILELNTEGFYAIPQEDGTVRLEIQGFVEAAEAGLPSVPVKRAWVEAVAGRDVRIASVRPSNLVAFSSLRPSAAEAPQVIADQSGVVQAGRRRRRWLRTLFRGDGLYPEEAAHVVSVAFQGEVKKALVEAGAAALGPSLGTASSSAASGGAAYVCRPRPG